MKVPEAVIKDFVREYFLTKYDFRLEEKDHDTLAIGIQALFDAWALRLGIYYDNYGSSSHEGS
jgi:hypothetical protein